MTNITITATRRAILGSAAALATATVANVAAISATRSPDPILAAIDRHRRAYDAVSDAVARNPHLPDEEGNALCDIECDRMRDLLRTEPSTVAGAVAMLRYLSAEDVEFFTLMMERGTEEDEGAAVRVLLQSVAAGLARIEVQS